MEGDKWEEEDEIPLSKLQKRLREEEFRPELPLMQKTPNLNRNIGLETMRLDRLGVGTQ